MANNKPNKRASGSLKSELMNPPPPPSDLPTSPTPAPSPPPPLVFKCIPTGELTVDAGDGLAQVKYTPQQIFHAVEEGSRLLLAGTIVRGLPPGKGNSYRKPFEVL